MTVSDSSFWRGKIPSNIRLFTSTLFGDRSAIEERYFPEKDLEALRQVVNAARARRQKAEQDLAQQLQAWQQHPPGEVAWTQEPGYERGPDGQMHKKAGETITRTAGEEARRISEQLAQLQARPQTIQYADYGPEIADRLNREGWVEGLGASFLDPRWRVATSVGRARIGQDEQGNTLVRDSYDWNYGKEVRDLPLTEQLRVIGSSISHPTQLGNMLGNYLAPDSDPRRREATINLGSWGRDSGPGE